MTPGAWHRIRAPAPVLPPMFNQETRYVIINSPRNGCLWRLFSQDVSPTVSGWVVVWEPRCHLPIYLPPPHISATSPYIGAPSHQPCRLPAHPPPSPSGQLLHEPRPAALKCLLHSYLTFQSPWMSPRPWNTQMIQPIFQDLSPPSGQAGPVGNRAENAGGCGLLRDQPGEGDSPSGPYRVRGPWREARQKPHNRLPSAG
uniref:Uncharacterized protein n=1 Tax=Myotis myotis TaxID=51298 RepID=A0A7J7ZZ68_MYOMY|nr:hypothetical protein mMyoMyo1_009996 [Myotis myotis]